jgi:hypothetical protein
METIVGRIAEIALLREVLETPEAELIAVYGRRRVGKTYLIRNVYEREMLVEITGIKNADLAGQLDNFCATLTAAFQLPTEIAVPKNWLHAFRVLIQLLETRPKNTKKVLFFDEFPWMDTPRSGFLAAFDHFWNNWASRQKHLVVVICGSAASWMIQNVVKNKGGLHNRLTRRIRLLPFNLYETEQFLQRKGLHYDRYQILQLYMATGGIPHYLKEIRAGFSLTQAIGNLCFTKDGLLRDEFSSLYASLFDAADKHVSIVRALAGKPTGMTRTELMAAVGLSSGGGLSRLMEELEESGFISAYVPFQKNTKDALFKLSDEYSLFYLKFIEGSKAAGESVWLAKSNSAAYRAWSGLAFENICLKHVAQIKQGLSIGGVYTEESAWRYSPKDGSEGTQIDLLLDRADHCINLIEIKFYRSELSLDKKDAYNLAQKRRIFQDITKTRKTVFITLMTTFGAKKNEYYLNHVQNQLEMGCLFEGIKI